MKAEQLAEEYDVVILGTGLTECILSGLLSVEGKKVLHLDRNSYYGGDCASLSLSQMFEKYRPGTQAPEALGRDRDWAIDQIPRFSMASGEFVKILVYTDVTRYLEFKQIAGSYVFKEGKIAKVPASEAEAISSPLMGLFEKRRLQKFMEFIQKYRFDNPATQQVATGGFFSSATTRVDLNSISMTQLYELFGLEAGTQDFIGHALALHSDDAYKQLPARDTYDRIILYMSSMAKYGKSPYIYPMYGLGDLPQGFARLSAIYGGTYMLDAKIQEIENVDGKVSGVKFLDQSGDAQHVKCKQVICDPSYAPDKIRKVGQVIRVICLLNHPVPNTDDADSVQIIIPQNQVGRRHDIYVAVVGFEHRVAGKGWYIAMVSTIVETNQPGAEVQAAMQLLGPVVDRFASISDVYEPVDKGTESGLFVSRSYDATSHFETVCDDVKDLYRRINGKDLDFKGKITRGDEDAQ